MINNFFDENITRPVVMEVNLNNFEYNVNKIQELVGENVKLMPVIKASGYGTHINQRLDIIKPTPEAIELLSQLMGEDVEPRSNFVFNKIDFSEVRE